MDKLKTHGDVSAVPKKKRQIFMQKKKKSNPVSTKTWNKFYDAGVFLPITCMFSGNFSNNKCF